MLVGAPLLICLLVQPLLGGQVLRLTQLRIRLVWLGVAALGAQIVIISVIPGGDAKLYELIHMGTYVALGVVVAVNLRLPGMWLIALGGLANALVIVANDGVMPASAAALEMAGLAVDPDVFVNSGVVEGAHLAFLGDVMAVPSWLPLANVFSVGDLLLVLGGCVLICRVCGARLPWRRPTGPALVLFDGAGAVEAVTPEAGELLGRLAAPGVAVRGGPSLPPEAFVVAGRARARALGRPGHFPELRMLDAAGRPLRLTASCLDGGADGHRVAVAISAA